MVSLLLTHVYIGGCGTKAIFTFTSFASAPPVFQLEREWILQKKLGVVNSSLLSDDLFVATDPRYINSGRSRLPSRYQDLNLPSDWWITGKGRRRKRLHRKVSNVEYFVFSTHTHFVFRSSLYIHIISPFRFPPSYIPVSWQDLLQRVVVHDFICLGER